MNTENKNSIIEKVNAQISSGKVCMRSRAVFVFKSIALAVLAFVVFTSSTFIVNFMLFSIHMQSAEELLEFGPRGWHAFFLFFPWGLLLVDILSTILLVMLFRTFRFGYRVPLLYIFGALVAMATLFGITLERHTPMNAFIMHTVDRDDMPEPVRLFGRSHIPPPPREGTCHCEVLSVTDATHFVVRDAFTGEEFVAAVTDETHATTTNLKVGDKVFLAGEMEDGVFEIFGLKRGEWRRNARY
jgi:hypothetical protein